MIPFGDILQKLRNDRNWSQAQLATRLGLSASQIANYEMARRFPSLPVLIDISHVFGVTTDYLLGISAEQKHLIDVSDLLPEEIASIDAVITCYRNSRGK